MQTIFWKLFASCVSYRLFKCFLGVPERSFCHAGNAIFGEIRRNAHEKVSLLLVV